MNLWKKTKQTNIKERNPNTGKPKKERKDRQTPYIHIQTTSPHLSQKESLNSCCSNTPPEFSLVAALSPSFNTTTQKSSKIKKVETDLNSSPLSSLILLPFRQQGGDTTITPTNELLLLCRGFFNCKPRQKRNNNKKRTNPITQKQTNTKFSNKICSSLQICKFCTDTKFSHKNCSLQNCKFLTLSPTFLCDISLVIFSTHTTQNQAGVLKISDFQLELLRLVFFHNFNHFDNFWPNICASQYTKKILLKFKRHPSNSSLVPKRG